MAYVHESPECGATAPGARDESARARGAPDTLVDLGALRGVIYTRDHCGAWRTYIHFMENPPRLLCGSDGRQLYVHGGTYRVTHRGIEG